MLSVCACSVQITSITYSRTTSDQLAFGLNRCREDMHNTISPLRMVRIQCVFGRAGISYSIMYIFARTEPIFQRNNVVKISRKFVTLLYSVSLI